MPCQYFNAGKIRIQADLFDLNHHAFLPQACLAGKTDSSERSESESLKGTLCDSPQANVHTVLKSVNERYIG
jgi:hypothetical protein